MQLTKIHWKLKKSQSKPIGNRNVKGRILRTGFTRGHKIRSKTEFKLISALFWELRATAGDVRYSTSMSRVQRVSALPTGLSPGSLFWVSNIFFFKCFSDQSVNVPCAHRQEKGSTVLGLQKLHQFIKVFLFSVMKNTWLLPPDRTEAKNTCRTKWELLACP